MSPRSSDDQHCRDSFDKAMSVDVFRSDAVSANLSMDSCSTASTDIETSFSKESDSSEDEHDSESSTRLRHRGAVAPNDGSSCNVHGWSGGGISRLDRGRAGKQNPEYGRRRPWVILTILLALGTLKSYFGNPIDAIKWNLFLRDEAPALQQEIERLPVGSSVTIRLKGTRLDLLHQSLDTFSKCSIVEEIQIDFEGVKGLPETTFLHGSGKAGPVGIVRTNAVFLLEEGVLLTCQDLSRAFKTWKNDPSRLVGFFAFEAEDLLERHTVRPGLKAIEGKSYSVVSDRAAIVHRLYLDTLPFYSAHSCCKTLLSMQVSATSKKSPVVMKGKPHDVVENPSSDSGSCVEKCLPEWMQLNKVLDLPDAEATILGAV